MVDLAAHGHTDAAIAHHLGISEATVATYWGRVRTKYGPLSRTELIAHIVRERYDEQLALLREENQTLIESLTQASPSLGTEESKDFFRQVLDGVADAVFVVCEKGMIEWANGSAHELLDYPCGSLVGRGLDTLVVEHYRKLHRQHVQDFFANPAKRTMAEHSVTYAVTADGAEREFVATLSAVDTPHGRFAICVMRHVPERRPA